MGNLNTQNINVLTRVQLFFFFFFGLTRLIMEIKYLDSQISFTTQELQNAQASNLELQETRSLLEDEVRVKRKSLWTDCIRCQKVRAFYPSVNLLIGH